jgi:hypothetical protein
MCYHLRFSKIYNKILGMYVQEKNSVLFIFSSHEKKTQKDEDYIKGTVL